MIFNSDNDLKYIVFNRDHIEGVIKEEFMWPPELMFEDGTYGGLNHYIDVQVIKKNNTLTINIII